MKKCNTCSEVKSESEYYKSPITKSGLVGKCKTCSSEYNKKIRAKNPEKSRKQWEDWASKNHDHLREYREKNRERRREYERAYREKNRERLRENRRRHVANNRERVNLECARRNRERYQKDELFRVQKIYRSRVYEVLKRTGYKKESTMEGILGCSYRKLKSHIESQFQRGMSWENHGNKWHIDHIYPLASADTKPDLLKLFHYTNLQPLWLEDNLAKGKKCPVQWAQENGKLA